MNLIINFIYNSVKAGTPLLFGTTGEIITEKSGSMNLGVEGMMALGSIFGYWIACATNSFIIGLFAAFAASAIGAAVFAILTIAFQANQNVTGLALTTFGLAVYQFVGQTLTTKKIYPDLSGHAHIKYLASDNGIPVLNKIPYVGKLLFSYNIFVYIAIAIAIICWVYMEKTKFGLKIRAIGENPGAADACGVNVNLVKYFNVILGGGICGLGGFYLGIVSNGGGWNSGWINGAGWISVALVIFAKWDTKKAIAGSFFFGALQTLLPYKGNFADKFTFLSWLNVIPNEFYQMLPFVITALVLIISSIKNKKEGTQPAACGINYYREER